MLAYANQSISTSPAHFPLFSGASGGGGGLVGTEFLAKEAKACTDLSMGRAATQLPFNGLLT